MTLIKLFVARFEGTGSFLIGYYNSHMKLYHQLKKFLDYIVTEHCFSN